MFNFKIMFSSKLLSLHHRWGKNTQNLNGLGINGRTHVKHLINLSLINKCHFLSARVMSRNRY